MQAAEGHCMLHVLSNCGTRRTTEVRTVSWCNVLFLQLTTQTAQTTVCAIQIRCLKDIICSFTAPRTHARTHSRTHKYPSERYRMQVASLWTYFSAVSPALLRYAKANSEQCCTNCFARRPYGFAKQELTGTALIT